MCEEEGGRRRSKEEGEGGGWEEGKGERERRKRKVLSVGRGKQGDRETGSEGARAAIKRGQGRGIGLTH